MEVTVFIFSGNFAQEEVVSKTKSFERLKMEAEKCLTQSERFSKEKMEFESATYAKVRDLVFHACIYIYI